LFKNEIVIAKNFLLNNKQLSLDEFEPNGEYPKNNFIITQNSTGVITIENDPI